MGGCKPSHTGEEHHVQGPSSRQGMDRCTASTGPISPWAWDSTPPTELVHPGVARHGLDSATRRHLAPTQYGDSQLPDLLWIHCQRCNGSALDLNHLKSARACPICGHGDLGSSVNLLGVSAEAPGCLFQDLERSEEAGAPVAQPIHFVFPSQAARGGSSGRSDPPPQRLGRGTSHHLPPPPTSLEKPLFKGRR